MIKTLTQIARFLSTTKQWVESESQLFPKISRLANFIQTAKHPIFFTGAGCSTSIGIPDYRSGIDTIVGTGPGVWNRHPQDRPKLRIDRIVDNAIPSFTHMAIKKLIDQKIFKFLISQNTDGLHLKSGVKSHCIAELHGNRNLEKCVSCRRQYLRDFRTIKRGVSPEEQKLHLTGRKCENCQGDLIDSIVYFGEKLPQRALTTAFQQASTCDLLVCIGSSLTVQPSVNVPILALKNKANVCIINIQETPIDQYCTLKLNGFCDDVMKKLMSQLNIQVKEFETQHFFKLEIRNKKIVLTGQDQLGNNFTCIRTVICQGIEYAGLGHCVEVPYSDEVDEIQLSFFGDKADLNIHLPTYYKIFHGEPVTLKLTFKLESRVWDIAEI